MSLPCLTTNVYLLYKWEFHYAAVHLVGPVVLGVLSVVNDRFEGDGIAVCNIITAASLAVLSFQRENLYGVAAALSHILFHINDQPIATLGMSLYCFLGMKTILVACGVDPNFSLRSVSSHHRPYVQLVR